VDNSDPKASSSWSVVLVIAVVGFAIFLSSVWTARNETALVPDIALYTARFVKAASCFCIAFLFRNHMPSIKNMVGLGALCIAAHLVLYVAMYAASFDDSFGALIGFLSGAFSGIGEACIILVFAHLFSTFEPRVSVVAISVAYLLNEMLYAMTLYMPSDVLLVIRPIGKALGIALLVWCLPRKLSTSSSDSEYPLQYGMSTKPDRAPIRHFLSSGGDWALILAATTLFPLLFGFIAQLCSSLGTNSGLYDAVSEFVAIVLLACLVFICVEVGTKVTFDHILYVVYPIFATGCVLLPTLWYQGSTYAGMLVKCGYTIYQILLWTLLARKTYEDLRHSYFYFGLFYGIFELTTAAARLSVHTYSADMLDQSSMAFAALIMLWLIAMYGLVFFILSKRAGSTTSADAAQAHVAKGAVADHVEQVAGETVGTVSTAASGSDASGAISKGVYETTQGSDVTVRQKAGLSRAGDSDETKPMLVDPFVVRLYAFERDFGLSERECDVLTESIHGYSMENIGKKLFLSRETVKTYLSRIYAKAGVGGKQELITFIDHYDLADREGSNV
jgi:DNA-binding CsgD family transcriptional regulator/uncharacterized protein (UPF0333 family)